jgi:hypothetical protein
MLLTFGGTCLLLAIGIGFAEHVRWLSRGKGE